MTKKKLKILVIININDELPANYNFNEYLKNKYWKTARHVVQGLKKLGHQVKILGIYNNFEILINEIKLNKPDVVFNLCYAFNGKRAYLSNVIALLELMQVKFTGANSFAARLCLDKALTKKILTYHNISVPDFVVSPKNKPLTNLTNIKYPSIVKPLNLDGSVGISQASIVKNEKLALNRIKYVHKKFMSDAIIEEFIVGREVSVTVLGNKHPIVLSPREVIFSNFSKDKYNIDSYSAKWREKLSKRWRTYYIKAKNIDPKLFTVCKNIYKILNLRGYARFDFRISTAGQFYFIEANPSPGLIKRDHAAAAAKNSGIDYESLLQKIITLALN